MLAACTCAASEALPLFRWTTRVLPEPAPHVALAGELALSAAAAVAGSEDRAPAAIAAAAIAATNAIAVIITTDLLLVIRLFIVAFWR
jgi:hypothetical protein